MAKVRQVGGGLSGHIHIVATDGTVWDSSPADHIAVLAMIPSGPKRVREHFAEKQIAKNIALAFGKQIDADHLSFVIEWDTGTALEVRIG